MCFGTLTAFRQDGQIIHLSFEGKKARVEIITPKIVNIFCGFESEDHRSKAIEGSKAVPVEVYAEISWLQITGANVCHWSESPALIWNFLQQKAMSRLPTRIHPPSGR